MTVVMYNLYYVIVLNSDVPTDSVSLVLNVTLFYKISISWLNYYTLYYKYKINCRNSMFKTCLSKKKFHFWKVYIKL